MLTYWDRILYGCDPTIKLAYHSFAKSEFRLIDAHLTVDWVHLNFDGKHLGILLVESVCDIVEHISVEENVCFEQMNCLCVDRGADLYCVSSGLLRVPVSTALLRVPMSTAPLRIPVSSYRLTSWIAVTFLDFVQSVFFRQQLWVEKLDLGLVLFHSLVELRSYICLHVENF